MGLLRNPGSRGAALATATATAALALALAWLLAGGAPAASHSGLERAEPAAGAVLAAAPERVEAWFVLALRDNGRNVLAVSSAAGERVDEGAPLRDAEDPTHLSTGLRPGLGGGVYRVDWRGSGEDGHPTEGSFEFTVDPDAAGDGSRRATARGALVAAAAGGAALVGLLALLRVTRARRRGA